MNYNRVLAEPWDDLNWEQQAQSLQLAYRAGYEIGTERASGHDDRNPSSFDDFDLYVLQDDEFNDGAGDDAPVFQNTWKVGYWPSAQEDLRVVVFISACNTAKHASGN